MGMQHAGNAIVGDIASAPGEETIILEPVQGLTLITLAQPLTSLSESPEAIPVRIVARAAATLQAGKRGYRRYRLVD